ncbi:MAG: hypothetical protein L0H51_08920, partial [Psychrobacter sp.]|nr:hypothetical protein [Psychrobacter sp.]
LIFITIFKMRTRPSVIVKKTPSLCLAFFLYFTHRLHFGRGKHIANTAVVNYAKTTILLNECFYGDVK